jgi:acetylglutamate kinase
VALTGRDAGLLKAEAIEAELGRVGEVSQVSAQVLKQLLDANLTPLIAPIGLDARGPLNINADTAAGAVAGALDLPAVFLTDVVGVLQNPKDPSTRYGELKPDQIATLIAEGIISGGMIPKVEAALNALRQGAPWAAIAKGEAGILEAILAGTKGTKIVHLEA